MCNVWLQMRVWLQIQGSRVWSRSGPILSWRLIMKWFLRSFSSLPLIHSRRVVVSYERKYVHKLLVNRLFKPAQEKVWLGELTVPQWPAVDLGRKATNKQGAWLFCGKEFFSDKTDQSSKLFGRIGNQVTYKKAQMNLICRKNIRQEALSVSNW